MGTTGSGKTTGGKTGTSKPVAKKTATAPAAKRLAKSGTAATPRKSGSEKALANTRALLETKLAHDRQAPAWHAFDAKARGKVPKAGYQSEEAKARAAELHEGESRLEGIEGSLSTQDRRTQGKRDSR